MLFNVVVGGQASRRAHVVSCLFEAVSSEYYRGHFNLQQEPPLLDWESLLRRLSDGETGAASLYPMPERPYDPGLAGLGFGLGHPYTEFTPTTLIKLSPGLSYMLTDILLRLLTEILLVLLVALDSASVCNLRLSSRRIASLSSPSSILPQAFWRSPFEPGHEMAFYYAAAMPAGDARPTAGWSCTEGLEAPWPAILIGCV